MAALAGLEPGDTLTFSRLQQLLALTGGNLITHLRRLEDAGYVTSQRVRGIRGEVTTASLTEQGRRALAAYRATLADILDPVDG